MWRFEDLSARGLTLIEGEYALSIVIISVLIAAISAYAMLMIVERLWSETTERVSQRWLWISALTMGVGIWSMHFTGMYAFQLPRPMSMHIPLTLMSILPACLGAYFAVRMYAAQKFDFTSMTIGALCLALGIGTMHYVGMEAMHYEGLLLRYDPLKFVLSIVLAFVFALAALYVRAWQSKTKENKILKRCLAALLIGFAVSAMHYTAMVASEYYIDSSVNFEHSVGHEHEYLAWIIVLDVFLLIGALILAVILGAKFDWARRAALASEQRENAVISALADALLVLDEDGNVTTYNVSAQRLFGALHSPLESKNITMLIPEMGSFEALKDWDNSPLQQSSIGLSLHFSVSDKRGLHHFEAVFSRLFIYDSLHYVAMIRDITKRVEMEQQLRQAQKLESIGQLAAGIAHEINTPIQYVSDNINFLKKASGSMVGAVEAYRSLVNDVTDESHQAQLDALEKQLKKTKFDFIQREIPKSIDQSLDGLQRVSTIVKAMKSFSHASEGQFSQANLKDAFESTITICRNEWKYEAELSISVPDDLPPVQLILDEFNQVILNLIVNAAHAIADKRKADNSETLGKIELSAEREGEMLCVRVRDNGGGIPDDIKERVFEPFFTTKAVGKGTGQGLNIVYSVIVEKHNGLIELDSKEGEGTCFTLRIPISQPSKLKPE